MAYPTIMSCYCYFIIGGTFIDTGENEEDYTDWAKKGCLFEDSL